MTVEIMRKKSEFIYRINMYNHREIDRRVNRRGARWMFFSRHETASHAITALLQLERQDKDTPDAK